MFSSTQTIHLPEDIEDKLTAVVSDWAQNSKVERLWQQDASLWTGRDESKWLGWLHLAERGQLTRDVAERLRKDISESKLQHSVLLGMGGSSLCAEVLAASVGPVKGYPELTVLDSTDPAQISSIDLSPTDSTLFIVSSKSGTTLETDILRRYFFDRVRRGAGSENPGSQFIAITDPGSKLEDIARADEYRHLFFGLPSVGGRYSALSNFGIVPAIVMGIDALKLLERAAAMSAACGPGSPVEENPGVLLGATLGVCGREGRDKITIFASSGVRSFGAWLEQLLAESTGKQERGLIPVDREDPGAPSLYGDDRLFIHLRLDSDPDEVNSSLVTALRGQGHPVVQIVLRDRYDLGAEFFRWEFATAVAGSVLELNPFDQPDVEASKKATRRLTDEFEESGELPSEQPLWEEGSIQLFAPEQQASVLKVSDPSLASLLRAHLERLESGDFFAILAYLQMNEENERLLQQMRMAVRDRYRVATCLGFGPRFQHSTGQAYKGGTNSGVFLQITCEDELDLEVPGHDYTFGLVKAAQAGGDFQVLKERGRRILRVHLPADTAAGLRTLLGLFSLPR